MMDKKQQIKQCRLLTTVAGIALIIDQLTKAAARFYLDASAAYTLIPGFLDLRLSFNRGAAFGLFAGYGPLFLLLAIVIVYAVYKLRYYGTTPVMTLGMGMLVGGALGNVIDRLTAPARGVTDFIDIHFGQAASALAWPTFNIADVALVGGAIIMLLFSRVQPGEDSDK